MKLISFLTLASQRKVGAIIGKLAYVILKERRKVCFTNIKLCFPNLDDNEQTNLVKENFKYFGIGIIEASYAWFSKKIDADNLVEVKNSQYYDQCKEIGNGILLLAPHNYSLELCGRLMAESKFNFNPTFRHVKNPVINYIMQKSRARYFDKIFYKNDLRKIIKSLKNNENIWNAADQDFGREHSVFADFFNIPTATITSLSKLSNLSKAPILPVNYFYNEEKCKYIVEFGKPLFEIPSGNLEKDAHLINQIIEDQIKSNPEQYFWIHKRFKTRPLGSPEIFYKNKISNKKFNTLIEKSKIIKENKHGPKLLLNKNNYIKIFYRKSGLSSTRFKSYADKFIKNSIILKKLNIKTISPEKVFYIKDNNHPRNPHFITYKELPGNDLRNIINYKNKNDLNDHQTLIIQFIDYLAQLHQKGVFFRSLHLGNILEIKQQKDFALIDIADVRFNKFKSPLSLKKSIRNIRHLFNDPNDFQLWLDFGHQKFIEIYAKYRNLNIHKAESIMAEFK